MLLVNRYIINSLQAHSLLYSYIPFCLLAVNNLFLIYSIHVRKKAIASDPNSSHVRKKKSMNRTVIFITLIFILMTLPSSIASIYFDQLIISSVGSVILIALDALSFSYHGLNILVLLYTNQQFKRDFKVFFCLWRNSLQLGSSMAPTSRSAPSNQLNRSTTNQTD